MSQELNLRRKWTFRAHDRQQVFEKKALESDIHVLTKAFIWAIYLPRYPDLSVEISVGNRYKPDVVQLDQNGVPLFWGEAGRVGQKKLGDLLKRFRSTHFVFAKWNSKLTSMQRMVERETRRLVRSAPVDLISFPAGAADHFIDPSGNIEVNPTDFIKIRC